MRELTIAVGVDLPQPHADQVEHADARAADQRADVQADELKQDAEDDQQEQQDDDNGDRPAC